MRVPLFLRVLNGAMARHPLIAATGFCTFKAGSADAFTQTVLEKREKLDLPRLGVFLAFGCVYQGLFQYFLWVKVWERIWPGSLKREVCSKIVATNLCDPIIMLPMFYVFQEGFTTKNIDVRELVVPALTKFYDNCYRDIAVSWSTWFPGHFVTYWIMPIHLRIPWVACASFGYVCILSSMRGSEHMAHPSLEARYTVEVAPEKHHHHELDGPG